MIRNDLALFTVPRSDLAPGLVSGAFLLFLQGESEGRPMADLTYSDEFLRGVLKDTRTIAGFAMSAKVIRPSWFVGNYMRLHGYKVVAVNPVLAGQSHFGSTAVASLADIPEELGPVDMVDIFRRSDMVMPIVEDAIAHLLDRGLKYVWMQIGVVNHEAAALAESHGLTVIMNRCPKMEYQRLCGELRLAGISTGIISSKLPEF